MVTNGSAGHGSGDVPAAAPFTVSESPQPAEPPVGALPGQEDLLGRRIAAALVDVALLTGLFVILGLAVGQVGTGGAAGYGVFLAWPWSGWYLAVVLVYYFALEASIGQTAGKCLLGLRVVRRDGTRPSIWAITGRTLLRLIDWLPALYLAGFITMLATGRRRRQRLGDLAARTAVARALPMRHRSLALAPLALAVLAIAGLSAYRATTAGGTQTYRAHGIAFDYPAGWQEENPSSSAGSGNPLWRTAFGQAGDPADFLIIEAYRLNIPVGAGNLGAVAPQLEDVVRRAAEQAGGALQAGPQEIMLGRMPGLRFRAAVGTVQGTPVESTLSFGFDGTTEYVVNCQHTEANAAEVEAACGQVVRTFMLSKAA
jgi:uncharacterized RDD family membrane protein YckC